MASSKTTGRQTSSRQKTASKTQKRGGTAQKKTAGRTTAKRPAALTKAQEEKLLEQKRQRNQVRAVVLFAAAILMGCMVLIPGENVWHWFHDLFMGLFGTWAILWPILLIYVAVMTAMERPVGRLRSKIILSVVIIILACSTSYIFSDMQSNNPDGYFSILGQLYTMGTTSGGAGLSGGLLGYPFVAMMGGVGSKIAILLVLFVALMILTGTTLVQLFRTMAKPAKVVATNVNQVRERYEVQRQQNRMTNIDIAVDDDELPAHPVQSPIPQPVGAKGEGKKASVKNEKRERLFQVFGMGGKKSEPVAEQEPVKKEEEGIPQTMEKPAVAEEAPLPASAEAAVQAARDAFHTEEKVVAKAEQEKEDLHPAQPQLQTQSVSSAANVSQRPSAFPGSDSPQVSHDGYVFPPTSMLEASRQTNAALELEEQQHNGQLLVQTLKNFGVQTKILDICRGPAVTRYELQPAAGVKISKITNLSDDIAMNLAASGVRIEAPIPGKAAVGIEVPNKHKSVVRMRELIESNSFITAKGRLTVALGRDIAGQVTCADLAKMPHVLIAGTTGSGKSVCINSLIISLLYKSTPDEVRFLMIDPKVVELGIYNGIPHLLVPVVTDPRKAAGALGWAVTEMLNRYKTFADCNVRDLSGYNKLAESKNYQDDDGQPMLRMPQIVIIIDELADLMMAAPNEVEDSICRLAQMARAAGMHLVVATQRPSVDVVTGLIKANIPSRIAFTVSSPVDSRTILDTSGAEKLLGQGDMLFAPVGCQKPVRIQGCFVSDSEIESIVNFVKHTREETEYDSKIMEEIEKNAVQEREKSSSNEEDPLQDPMINEAIKCVVEAGQASTSLLQRRLRLGYARAGRLIDELEQLGVVGPHEGSKPRQVLMTYQQWLERSAQQPD